MCQRFQIKITLISQGCFSEQKKNKQYFCVTYILHIVAILRV